MDEIKETLRELSDTVENVRATIERLQVAVWAGQTQAKIAKLSQQIEILTGENQ